MKKISLIILLLLSTKILFAQIRFIPIVPQPQKTIFTEESFEIRNQSVQLKLYYDNSRPLEIAVNDLINIAKENQNAVLSESLNSNKTIYIGIKDFNNNFTTLLNELEVTITENIGDEGYQLFINKDKIVIVANNQNGLFYGIQSLKQLFRGNKNKNALPGLRISDYPSFKYRAIMDDISRGPIPTLDYMKYQIRRLSEMKINTFIHYVEHVVKTKRHPEFAPEDGSLTIEEWKEIADYALDYNITVIGGFQSFGHFQNILATPEYSHLGESGSLISPVKPESYEFLKNIYDEMIPAFHSDIFNINCDETFDLGKEDSKALVDSIGYGEVYFQHIMKLYDIVKSHDKRIIMWGDILMQYPELIYRLPKDVLIGTWNYDAQETFDEFINPFKNSEHEFWVVPGVLNSRRIYPDFDKAFENIKVFIEEGFEAGATGVLNCFWDDGNTGLFSNDWYGAAYGADKSWNVFSDGSKFDERYAEGHLGTENTHLLKAIQTLNELRFLELTDGMTDKFLFVKLIPDSRESNKISVADLDRALAIINETDSELKKVNNLVYRDDAEYLKFIINLYRTLAQERFDLLEAANIYREAEELYLTEPSEARLKIIDCIEIITKIIDQTTKLKNRYEILWLEENHTYALDWITNKYDQKINDYADVKKLLFKSLKNFDSSKPILSLKEVRLSISKLPGKYFTEWMMINPLPNNDMLNVSEIDYLLDMGGEANANPKVTQEFYYDNEKYRWRRVVSEQQDIVNLNEIFDYEKQSGVMYAFANISIDEANVVEALVGFSDGIEVFINGQSVYKGVSNNLVPDKTKIILPLEDGKNNLLLKVTNLKGDWGFSIRLPNSEVRNSKNRYKIVNSKF